MKHGMRLFCVLAVFTLFVAHGAAGPPGRAQADTDDSARVILQRFGDAWRGGREMEFERDFVVAFWVRGERGGEYHLVLSPEPGADVREGAPERYDVGFELDIDLLTAMGRARSSDTAPLDFRAGPLLEDRPDAMVQFRRLAFHFWTRGWPEIVPFGENAARLVHGGNAAVLVYDREFRSAWYQLRSGMHINADPDDQTNDFPQLVIVTRGRFTGRFDGEERVLAEGDADTVICRWRRTGLYTHSFNIETVTNLPTRKKIRIRHSVMQAKCLCGNEK
jgi:hypothetical protein